MDFDGDQDVDLDDFAQFQIDMPATDLVAPGAPARQDHSLQAVSVGRAEADPFFEPPLESCAGWG